MAKVPIDLLNRKRYPSFGECIYCQAKAAEKTLCDEHVVPFSLGGNVIIEKASCDACARETTSIESELGRNVFWDFRAHIGEQTRRPKERPKERSFTISINDQIPETHLAAINSHPFSTVMPVWRPAGILMGAQPSKEYRDSTGHLYWWEPPNLADSLNIDTARDRIKLWTGGTRIDFDKFARAIAKIAYCQTILKYGLHGFRRLILPDLILGRYPMIPHFVGVTSDSPPPPHAKHVKHAIQIEILSIGRMKLIVAHVRLYANSGTDDHGYPIYHVVCGAPLIHRNL